MSRIFISHSSANNAAALALASWLNANGWGEYFLDLDSKNGIRTGERWMTALKSAAERCEAVICLVSPEWLKSDMCKAEFHLANFLGKRIFGVKVEPILNNQLPNQMTSVWQLCDLTYSDDPISIAVKEPAAIPGTVVQFPRAGLERLKIGLKNAGLDASTFVWPPEKLPDRSPYPGLLAFDEPDAAIFFGREASIVRGIDQMRLVRERDVEQIFVILGASGAGKSSFLRAGLLPRLKRDSDHFWVLPTIRPENKAISGSQGLLSSLEKSFSKAGQPLNRAQVREQLASIGLAGILRKIQPIRKKVDRWAGPAEPTFILPIDQAEELFASDGLEEARGFLDYIEALHQSASTKTNAGSERLRILLVLTIRSDSLPKLQEQPILQRMFPVLFSLPIMPVSEYKAVIEGPARRHSERVKPLVITPELTEKLIQDTQGADALPLLAFTLERLYREFTTPQGTQIGCPEYQKIGGVRGIIGAAVEHVFEDPDRKPRIPSQREEQETLLRQVFPYIATVDPDTGDWKRRVTLRENLRQNLPQQADSLVSRLIEQRLLLTDSRPMNDGGTPVEVIEVAHESLLRQWDKLEGWLREFAEALSIAESIRRSAIEWDRSGQNDDLLFHTGHRLDAAEAVLSDNRLKHRFEAVDKDYLAACRLRDRLELEEREKAQKELEKHLQTIAEQQTTKATLQKRVTLGLSIAAAVILGLLEWSISQTREVSLQKSQVLTSAAEKAADENRFDQSLRLAVLAAKESWPLYPAHPNAAAILTRAADAITLRLILFGHKDSVSIAIFSPDGKRVLTVSKDTARVWDAETGKAVGFPMQRDGTSSTLKKESGKMLGSTIEYDETVNSANFSPDGKRVLTASWDTARVWDADTGKALGVPMKHDNNVKSARFSPDGKRVLTAALDGTTHIWDAESGKELGVPMKHDDYVISASFSPDGKRVVTTSQDNTARVWDAESGKALGAPMKHDTNVYSASFSPDGKRVVTTSQDNTARVWDAESGKELGVPMKHDNEVTSASFSPDGKRVLTVSEDNTARVWNVDTGMSLGVPMKHDNKVTTASFSPDGKRVVTTSQDNTARVWDAESGKALGVPMKHDNKVTTASFSPDGKRVVTASYDKTARVWDTYISKALGVPMEHSEMVTTASFSPNGKRVVTASQDNTARLWDAESGKALGVPMKHDSNVYSASFSPDGKRVVTTSQDNTARVWDAESGKALGAPMKHDTNVYSASFSPDGKRVITATRSQMFRFRTATVCLWDAETGKNLGVQMEFDDWLSLASFSPDGKRVLTVSWDTARVWDADTGKALGVPMKHDNEVKSARFSPDGKRVLTAALDGTTHIWDAESGKELGVPMKHDDYVISASFSPDGKRVVTTSQDNTARVWDAESGKALGAPMKHDTNVYSASFSPDGKRVVTTSQDNTARVWDAESGKELGVPMKHDDYVISASFSPDGKRVVTTSDRTARVWDLYWSTSGEPKTNIAEVCDKKLRHNVRNLTETDVIQVRVLPELESWIGKDVCEIAMASTNR